MEPLLVRFGPLAVLIGTAVEGDATALLAGVLAHLGFMELPLALALAALGGWLSDCAWYMVGRRGGARVRRSAAYARIAPFVERLAARLGPWEIVPARFVYGARIPSVLFWGVHGLPFARFAAISAVACLTWAMLFVGLGFTLSGSAEAILGKVKRIELWLAGALTIVASVVLFRHFAARLTASRR